MILKSHTNHLLHYITMSYNKMQAFTQLKIYSYLGSQKTP
jgi:hypothetical protein